MSKGLSIKSDIIAMLYNLARALDNGQMTSLDIYSNLNILLDKMRSSGVCGPKVESQKIVIERAEAKPPEKSKPSIIPTVSENAESVYGMISAVIEEMNKFGLQDSAYIDMLRAIQCSQAMKALEKYQPPSEASPPAEKLWNFKERL